MAMGTCWRENSWQPNAWQDGSWADAIIRVRELLEGESWVSAQLLSTLLASGELAGFSFTSHDIMDVVQATKTLAGPSLVQVTLAGAS